METVKVAIAIFGENVSPRGDFADELMVVDICEGKVVKNTRMSLCGFTEMQRLRAIAGTGASSFVSGGVNGYFHRMLQAHGCGVVCCAGAGADEVVDMLCRGETLPELSPGRGCGKGRGRRKRNRKF